jgi:hypothetical protein
MSCIQLNVGGSGTANPAGVSLPGAYKATDPGVRASRRAFHTPPMLTVPQILINIYSSLTTYACEFVGMQVRAMCSCR